MKIMKEEWMKNIDGKQPLFALAIPGTHDCVTQYVQFSHFAKCQDRNIYEQLCLGIRALDIRVRSNGDRLSMVHAIAKTFNTPNKLGKPMDMEDVLRHCYRFLDEHPSEAIVFQFKMDHGDDPEHCFDNLYETYIKANEEKWYLKNRAPLLEEARGKIVLLRRCKMNMENSGYTADNTGIDFSHWVEQPELVPDALTLRTCGEDNTEFLIQDRFKYTLYPKWEECVKPFLDGRKPFDGQYVICYFSTSGGLSGPRRNAAYINGEFMQYGLDKSRCYGTIYLDFPTEELTEKIIDNNF